MFACAFYLSWHLFLGPGKLMSRALVSMRFCGGSKSGLARTKWASDHQLYKYGRSMYSGAPNEKRTETFVMFKKLIRPLINCIYKFACKKHSNVEEKSFLTTTTCWRKWWFLLETLERSVLIQGFFLGKKTGFFPKPRVSWGRAFHRKRTLGPARGTCETSHRSSDNQLGSPTP